MDRLDRGAACPTRPNCGNSSVGRSSGHSGFLAVRMHQLAEGPQLAFQRTATMAAMCRMAPSAPAKVFQFRHRDDQTGGVRRPGPRGSSAALRPDSGGLVQRRDGPVQGGRERARLLAGLARVQRRNHFSAADAFGRPARRQLHEVLADAWEAPSVAADASRPSFRSLPGCACIRSELRAGLWQADPVVWRGCTESDLAIRSVARGRGEIAELPAEWFAAASAQRAPCSVRSRKRLSTGRFSTT